MIEMGSHINVVERLHLMSNYFKTNVTKNYVFRKQQLTQLKNSILKYEDKLYESLYIDLKKNKEESWVTEIGFVVAEINAALKNLHVWMKPKKPPPIY